MALAFTLTQNVPARGGAFGGGLKFLIGQFTLDTDYPDGGYTNAAIAAACGLRAVVFVAPGGHTSGTDVGYSISYVGGKLKVFESAGDGDPDDEAADGLDALDTLTADALVIGY